MSFYRSNIIFDGWLSNPGAGDVLSPGKEREMLLQMLTIRRFEKRPWADYLASKLYGVVHCYTCTLASRDVLRARV
jgi:hypothetical protein